MKTEDITSAILKQLTISCTECDIITLVIDTPSFACFSESPTSVTYRAGLKSISETDSGSLISLIEDWVSGGTSIIVTGVLMTVDSKCSVAISSLSEGECQPPPANPTTDRVTTPDPTSDPVTDSSTTDNTAAIIGGVVAVVLIITFAVVAIVMTLILKIRCENVSIGKQKE